MTPRSRILALSLAAALAVTTVDVAVPAATAGAQTSYSHRLQAKRSLAVWDRVAACESSHQWDINTHNGFYGGLQFLQATWVGFGGRKYARRADLAMRSQQIAVARRVLAMQGPKAWPVCGKRAHLNRRTGFATSTALPDIGSHHPAKRHHKPTHHKPKHHKTKHHKTKRHHAKYRHYRVRNGDSLSSIAAHFHVGVGKLWFYNRAIVPHGNLVLVGQVLRIPPRHGK